MRNLGSSNGSYRYASTKYNPDFTKARSRL